MPRQRDRTGRGVDTPGVADRPVFDGFAQAAGTPPALRTGGASTPAPMPGKAAGAMSTRRAMRHAGHVEGVGERLGAIAASGLRDVLSDDEARAIAGVTEGVEEPRTPQNLPAVIQTAVAVSGERLIVPEWHMVRHLPGYLQQPIRALGRQVFGQFTDTPVEDIQTVTTLTNDVEEVKGLMGWISRNGIRDDQAEMDFEGTIPDYKAFVQVWNVSDYTFLLVRDFAGHYVYGWPGGRGVHLEHEARPLLG